MPKTTRSIDGKRHGYTVPVRIRRPENILHKSPDDTEFAQSTMCDLKQIACTIGSRAVFYSSQDDKCRNPIGIPAAHKQAPLIMSIKIQIKLPDHDFVVGTKYKLISSSMYPYLFISIIIIHPPISCICSLWCLHGQ